jgi:hypothetical protein
MQTSSGINSVHRETALSPDRSLAGSLTCRVAQSPWESGLAETAKGAGPFQRTEVRQRDKGPLRNNPYFFIHFFTAPYAVHEPEKYWLFLHDGSPLAACQAKWSRKDVRSAFSSSSRLARKRNCSFPDGH